MFQQKALILQGQENVGKSKAGEIPESSILKQSDSLSVPRKLPLRQDAPELLCSATYPKGSQSRMRHDGRQRCKAEGEKITGVR